MPRPRRAVLKALLLFFVVAALLGARRPARDSGQHQRNSVESLWSLYVTGAKGNFDLSPVCHQLSYFSTSPLRFDYEQDFFDWPANSFTSSAHTDLVGVIQKHRIYQIMQDTHHDPGKPPKFAWAEVVMRRILVEREVNEYCMILQETNSYGTLERIDPPTLSTIDGSPVLSIHDPVEGNGGSYQDAAWTFDHGIPFRLRFSDAIGTVLKQILPPGCSPYGGDPLDLSDFIYRSEVLKARNSMAPLSCGHVTLGLGIKNHRLTVISKRYTPPTETPRAH